MTRALVTGWLAGVVFGVGLVVSGMTVPANIQGFLDFSGGFRPQLALVMVGAIGVYAIAIRLPRVGRPLSRMSSRVPHAVDGSLLAGAALFGVGWGLAGYCPGPAVVAVGAGNGAASTFLVSSIAGILCADLLCSARPTEPGAAATLDTSQ